MMEYSTLRVCFSSPEGTSSIHTIFCKRHSARQSSEQTPTESTLFTLGWPPYCDKDNVSELFSRAGHVCAVYLQSAAGPVRKEDHSSFQSGPVRKEDQSSFQSGYIVFSNASEVTEALRLCSVKVAIPCGVCKVGLAKWTYRYVASRPLVSAMEVAVDEGVGDYDLRTEMGKAARKLLSQPDDDGWITVVKKGPRTSQVRDCNYDPSEYKIQG